MSTVPTWTAISTTRPFRAVTTLNLLRDAGRLQQAFDGRGRNEGTLNDLILSSSPEYLHQLNQTFEKEFGRRLCIRL